MAREEQHPQQTKAPGVSPIADQLAEERRKTAQLTAENERLKKDVADARALAERAEAEARGMAEDLRKASSGVLLDVGKDSAQLKESLTMASGFERKETTDGKESVLREAIYPQRGDVLCAGDEAQVAALQSRLGRKSRVFRVTPAVLSQAIANGWTES